MFSYKFIVDTARNNSLRLRLINNRKKVEVSCRLNLTSDGLENVPQRKAEILNIICKSLLTGYMARLDARKRGGSAATPKYNPRHLCNGFYF